jgi:hypothetical protein
MTRNAALLASTLTHYPEKPASRTVSSREPAGQPSRGDSTLSPEALACGRPLPAAGEA